MSEPAKLAVIDLGSNSFRLVVFSYAEPDETGRAWWRRTDEIHEAVRIGAGPGARTARSRDEPMERALETLELYAHFCRATGVEDVRPVATSRDPRRRQPGRVPATPRASAPASRCGCSRARRRRATATWRRSTRRRCRRRRARPRRRLDAAHARREPARHGRALVAARRRAHDGALPARRAREGQADQGAARARRASSSPRRDWLERGGRLVGVGGTVRNLAVGRRDRGRAAVLRRPGLRDHARGARRRSSSGSRSCRPPSAPACPGSRPRAAT